MELTDITQPWAGTRLARLHAAGCRVVHGFANWLLRHLVELTAAWNISAVHAQQQHQDSSSGPLTLVGALVIAVSTTAGVSALLHKELRASWRASDTLLREQNQFLRNEVASLREYNSNLMQRMITAEEKNTATIAALTAEIVELRGDLIRINGRQS